MISLRSGRALLGFAVLASLACGRHKSFMPDGAMEPTIRNGQVFFWAELDDAGRGKLARGDLVLYRTAKDALPVSPKRIVGLAGDSVEIHDGRLFVNGSSPLQYGQGRPRDPRYAFGPTRVPEGRVFLMGEDWDRSADSRAFGSLKTSDLVGIVRRIVN